MIRRLATLALLAGAICSGTVECAEQKTQEKAEPSCQLTRDDHSVYSALVADLGKPEDPEEAWQGKEMLVVNRTAKPTDLSDHWIHWGYRSNSKEAPAVDTLADFKAKAVSSCTVEARFGNPHSYRMIASAELDQTFAPNAGGWDNFYKKYPDAAGYWEFSRPGYNSLHNEAVLYVGHSCGGLCGTGHLYFLTKQNDQWRVKNRLMLWIS